jgi:hypothetical protein
MRALSLAALLAALPACFDPVHSDAVAALGGEIDGERPGPLHRPGQPCLTCHGSDGPGSPEMAVGGTVFDVRNSQNGASGATVVLTDATGDSRRPITNGRGNFYIFKREWDPVFPLRVEVDYGGASKKMTSRIGRDGSCATCHVGSGGSGNMPGVFAEDTK